MDKQNIAYPYSKLLLDNRKEPTGDICNTVDDSQNC